MPQLDICQLGVTLGQQSILRNISLGLEAGQIGCLLGPSGCGKTTLLRSIAGFEPVSSGRITLQGQTVSQRQRSVAVEQRNVGMVFQDFALFPHLSVADNIAFGLNKLSKPQRRARVDELLALTELTHRATAYPHQLSGGQQQRVALARALAPRPAILLLDEPFSSIDNELREQLARKVRDILKAEQVTAILVTHDQPEAFAMADIIGVIHQGELAQWDSAYQLYHQPATPFVADFIGEGRLVDATVIGSHQLETAFGTLTDIAQDFTAAQGQPLQVLMRPDDIVHDDNSPLQAVVKEKYFRGADFLYQVELHGVPLLCHASSHHDHALGEAIGIRLQLDHLVTFASA